MFGKAKMQQMQNINFLFWITDFQIYSHMKITDIIDVKYLPSHAKYYMLISNKIKSNYFIVRLKVDQRAGQLSLPLVRYLDLILKLKQEALIWQRNVWFTTTKPDFNIFCETNETEYFITDILKDMFNIHIYTVLHIWIYQEICLLHVMQFKYFDVKENRVFKCDKIHASLDNKRGRRKI